MCRLLAHSAPLIRCVVCLELPPPILVTQPVTPVAVLLIKFKFEFKPEKEGAVANKFGL